MGILVQYFGKDVTCGPIDLSGTFVRGMRILYDEFLIVPPVLHFFAKYNVNNESVLLHQQLLFAFHF